MCPSCTSSLSMGITHISHLHLFLLHSKEISDFFHDPTGNYRGKKKKVRTLLGVIKGQFIWLSSSTILHGLPYPTLNLCHTQRSPDISNLSHYKLVSPVFHSTLGSERELVKVYTKYRPSYFRSHGRVYIICYLLWCDDEHVELARQF